MIVVLLILAFWLAAFPFVLRRPVSTAAVARLKRMADDLDAEALRSDDQSQVGYQLGATAARAMADYVPIIAVGGLPHLRPPARLGARESSSVVVSDKTVLWVFSVLVFTGIALSFVARPWLVRNWSLAFVSFVILARYDRSGLHPELVFNPESAAVAMKRAGIGEIATRFGIA